MEFAFPNTAKYLSSINLIAADKLDILARELMSNKEKYERASQALRRRFTRGAFEVEGVDRGERYTKIKREREGGKYKYYVKGSDGNWNSPDERIWIVVMYALWQTSKKSLR